MGSYAECWLDSLYIRSTKNHFDSDLMRLASRPSDKRVRRCTVKNLPRPMRQWAERYMEDPEEKVAVVYYAAPATLVKDIDWSLKATRSTRQNALS